MSADESVESLIERCAQEPIRTPGSIQPWGTLLAFGLEDGRIHYHAENAPDFLGVESDLLGRSARKLPGVSDPMIQAPSSHHRTEWETGEDTVLRVRQWTDGNWGFLEYLPDSPPTESDIFQLQEEVEALIATTEISELLDRGVRHLQDLTGYDQVMAYRFRRSLDGEVVAETIRGDRPSYDGHRFPASDIPSQARSLYLEHRFRIIPDSRYEAVPIRGLHEEPLDLSGSRLRSVSPVHLQYLANMGVRASLSVSIVVEGRLWGLMAAHHGRPRPLPDSLQRAARLYGRQLSSHLELLHRSRQQRFIKEWTELFSLSARMAEHDRSLAEQIDQEAPQWLEMMDATGLVFWSEDEVRTWGTVPDRDELRELMSGIHTRQDGPVWATASLEQHVPMAEALRATASGVLAVGIPWDQKRMVVWLRPELVQEVRWGGNPHEAVSLVEGQDGETSSLSPRASFQSWVEKRRGESAEWTPREIEGARRLRDELLKARLVETERQQREKWQEAARTDDLTKLLAHGAFHEELGRHLDEASGSVILLYLDLDGFKAVNDQFGHQVGDRLLEAVSTRIKNEVREEDLTGRVGGDEFAIVLESASDIEQARKVAKRLVTALADPFEIQGHPIEISASVGMSRAPAGSVTADELLKEADDRMYRAKERGGSNLLGPER